MDEVEGAVQARMRADTYRFLAQSLKEPPSSDLACLFLEENPDMASVLGFDGALSGDAFAQVLVDIAADYNRLFLGMGPDPIAPYESVHTSPERLLMQDARDEVLACYRAFGVAVDANDGRPEDHIAFELGFMCHLCEEQATALTAGTYDKAEDFADAERAFLSDHLMRFADAVSSSLGSRARTRYYQAVGEVLASFMDEERALFGISGSERAPYAL